MDPLSLITICIFLLAQTGALVFYAGIMSRAIKDHDRRIDTLEHNERATALSAAQLKGELG